MDYRRTGRDFVDGLSREEGGFFVNRRRVKELGGERIPSKTLLSLSLTVRCALKIRGSRMTSWVGCYVFIAMSTTGVCRVLKMRAGEETRQRRPLSLSARRWLS